MQERFEHVRSRRGLLAAFCRYGALGLLGAGAAGIYAKRRRLVRQGKCIGGGICDGCRILARCDLPLALSARSSTDILPVSPAGVSPEEDDKLQGQDGHATHGQDAHATTRGDNGGK